TAPCPGRDPGDHRRWPGYHGGRQPGRDGGRWALDRVQHRVAVRAGLQRVSEPEPQLQVILRAQDDVREVRDGLHRLSGWLWYARRALRGPHTHPDGQGEALSRQSVRERLLVGT